MLRCRCTDITKPQAAIRVLSYVYLYGFLSYSLTGNKNHENIKKNDVTKD